MATKFGNKKTIVDGITFDSMLESRFYEFVKDLKAQGKIKDFEMQVEYELLPSFKKNGKTIRKISYIADFVVYHLDGSLEVFDPKGVETDVFKLKKKMFEYRYKDLELKSITFSKIDGGWITLEEVKKARKIRKAAKNK